jgi:hypothetical protein
MTGEEKGIEKDNLMHPSRQMSLEYILRSKRCWEKMKNKISIGIDVVLPS